MQAMCNDMCFYRNARKNKRCRSWTRSCLLLWVVTALSLTGKIILYLNRKYFCSPHSTSSGFSCNPLYLKCLKNGYLSKSTLCLLWLSSVFVPSLFDQQDDNSFWALLPRKHLYWQNGCPWLAPHLRCLSLVRSSWCWQVWMFTFGCSTP